MAATYTEKTGALVVPTDLAKVFLADRGAVGSSTAWTEVFYTLKNTFALTTEQGDKTEINVDQTTVAIAVKYGENVTSFTMRVPDMAKDMCDFFMTSVARTGTGEVGSAVSGETMWDTFTPYSYSAARKTIADKMVMVLFSNGSGFIVPHCEMVAVPVKNAEDPFTFDITGTVLAGDSGGEAGDIIFLYPGTPTP